MRQGLLVGIAVVGILFATTIALVALQKTLENEQKILSDERVVPSPAPAAQRVLVKEGPPGSNVFYSGVDLSVTLDKPIFGKPLYADLDQYDTVHPAVLARGALVVQGSGRMVLDGDASDLILKIDNEYFSLRQLLGIGRGIDTTPRPPPDSGSTDPDNNEYVNNLCASTKLIPRGLSCPLRNNFGTDSCLQTTGPTTCYCGGGYQPLGNTIRLRHFICRESDRNCEDLFINHNISAACCAPDASKDSFACKQVWTDLELDLGSNFFLYDRYVSCGQDQADTLCQNVDRSDYLRAYEISGEGVGLLDDLDTLIDVRNDLNRHSWGISRDLVLDDGNAYRVQLRNDVYEDCVEPRLRLVDSPPLPEAFYAMWTCELSLASEIHFARSESLVLPSREWGARYFALVRRNKHWYCLSQPVDSWTSLLQGQLVGQGATVLDKQVFFVSVEHRELCATLYLGDRDFGDYKTDKAAGVVFGKPSRFVVANLDLKLDSAIGIFNA